LTDFNAAALGFAVFCDLDFDSERALGFDVAFDFGLVNFEDAWLADNFPFAVVFAVTFDRLESASLIRFHLSRKMIIDIPGALLLSLSDCIYSRLEGCCQIRDWCRKGFAGLKAGKIASAFDAFNS